MATTYTEYLQIPKHDPADPFDIALINEGFDKTEAGILEAYRGRAAYNLLDNSDFRNPVNQRNPGTVTGRTAYVVDRWVFDHAEGTTANATADKTMGWIYMNRSAGTGFYSLRQSVSNIYMQNKKLTFAVDCNSYGVGFELQVVDEEWNLVATQQCTARNGVARMTFDAGSNTFLRFVIYPSANEFGIRWAAVYEGEYVLDNLPSYVPKGYAAELAECKRYYQKVRVNAIQTHASNAYYACAYVHNMRIVPTVTLKEFAPIGYGSITDFTGCTASADEYSLIYAKLPTCASHTYGVLMLTLSADL